MSPLAESSGNVASKNYKIFLNLYSSKCCYYLKSYRLYILPNEYEIRAVVEMNKIWLNITQFKVSLESWITLTLEYKVDWTSTVTS